MRAGRESDSKHPFSARGAEGGMPLRGCDGSLYIHPVAQELCSKGGLGWLWSI